MSEEVRRLRRALESILHDVEEYPDAETRLAWIKSTAEQALR